MANYVGTGSSETINGSLLDDTIYGRGGKDMLYGLTGNDYIDGGKGDDFLFGNEGDDILFGGKGNDTLEGGAGADQLKGGRGEDTASYADATSGVTVWIPFGTAGGYATGDTFINIENVVGSAYNDSLQAGDAGKAFGGAGDDQVYGSGYVSGDAGILRGDAGLDHLYMNYGQTRAWVQNGLGYDTIHTFVEGDDMLMIDLSDFGLGTSLDVNELVNSNTATAVGTNAQFIYEGDAGILWFDSNGTSGGGLVAVAVFTGSTIAGNNLDLGDFQTML